MLHELQVHQIELQMQNETLRQAQIDLEKSRDRYVDLYEFAPVGYLTVADSGLISEINLTGCALLGEDRKNLCNRYFASYVDSADRHRWLRHLHALPHGEKQTVELRLGRSDGTVFDAALECLRVVTDDDAPALRVVLTDITARKQAEKNLVTSQAQLKTLIQNAPIAIAMFDRNMDYLVTSSGWLAEFSRGYADLIGRNLYDVNPDIPAKWKHVHQQVLANATISNDDDVWIQADGSKHRLSWTVQPWTDETGAIGGMIIYAENISEKKRTEAERVHSQKMEAIGTLAGGIAHDFNNILTSILGFAQLILFDAGNPDEVADYARKIQSSGNRAKDLVRQILAFSREQPSSKTPIDLCLVVNEVYQLVHSAVPSTIRVTLGLPPGRAMVLGSASELHQVLMNLCVNAVDAIGSQHGRVSIVLARCDGGFDLSVTDSGCGIAEEIRPRIFDPFFTTKSAGKGTGLGLSVVHGMVEHLCGDISLESPPEGGTRFVIRLPELASGEAEAVATQGMLPVQAEVRARHILVVDDEPHIVELLRQFFERKGHRVSATTVSKEALGWIRKGERFDIVITDQTMPDVTGVELARAIAECAPATKVLVCSGRDDTVDENEIAAAHIDGFILKPLDLSELAGTMERLLENAPAVG
jgi:PAS domain S-box-containing protein